MKIRSVDISKITPYYNNPRENGNAVKPVMESIRRYGFIKPILCDKEGVIIAGHTRYMAAFQMGCEKVPVIYSDMSEEQAKQFRIADNKFSEKSEYDEQALADELKALSIPTDMQPFFFEDINSLLGFDFEGITSALDYRQEGEEDYGDSAPFEEEDEYEEESDEDLIYNDLYKVREVNGERIMKVVCPYCGNIETIKVEEE